MYFHSKYIFINFRIRNVFTINEKQFVCLNVLSFGVNTYQFSDKKCFYNKREAICLFECTFIRSKHLSFNFRIRNVFTIKEKQFVCLNVLSFVVNTYLSIFG